MSPSGPARRRRPPQEAGRCRRLWKPDASAASGSRPPPPLEPGRLRRWKPPPPLEPGHRRRWNPAAAAARMRAPGRRAGCGPSTLLWRDAGARWKMGASPARPEDHGGGGGRWPVPTGEDKEAHRPPVGAAPRRCGPRPYRTWGDELGGEESMKDSLFFKDIYFLMDWYVGPCSVFAASSNELLSLPPQHWHVGPVVRNCVNSLLDSHLLELQKLTPEMVDLRSKNVKWYHFINFASNVVVLCYSLDRCCTKYMAPRELS
jgi:hypothetical protein